MRRSDAKPRFERIAWNEIDWARIEAASDRILFQSRAWLEFLAASKGAEPVVAVLRDGGAEFGYFTGLLIQRMRLRVLGSPMPGWTTPYMGFNLDPGVKRSQAVEALVDFAFDELRCAHLELRDRWLTADDVSGLGFTRRDDVGFDERTFEIDLTRSEDELFAGMSGACRRCIRKAEKVGVRIEPTSDPSFADEYHAQLREVFARQGLVPTYGVDRVKALIRALQPTDALLLLRACDQSGKCIATGIFPGFNKTAYFWGGASWRADQGNRPNEALQWYAMRYWKQRGIERYDLGGFVEYKRKYGGTEVTVPGFRISKSPVVAAARTIAPMGMRLKQSVIGRAKQGWDRAAAPVLGELLIP